MAEFDTVEFEKRLASLKDTQDSIQSMSTWCLKNRANHKKVVSSWLNVLKQVKVEHRLILFYLANDVIQHSKRKNFEFVDSWGTTLQRATTMVRSDEKVKAKIIRIFSIWEQRDIYNDEFLADLRDLLNINPAKKQQPVTTTESDDEQVTLVSSNIRACVRLEHETDRVLKVVATSAPPRLYDAEGIQSLKDRRHAEDVEQQLTNHAGQLDACIRALHAEMKARRVLISVLEQTDAFYHNQRGEVKVVANAYRNFHNRIKTMKRKVDELVTTLPSPLPSPDINAPSPEPDNDFGLDLDGKLELGGSFLAAAGMSTNGYLSGFSAQGKLPFNISDFESTASTSSGERAGYNPRGSPDQEHQRQAIQVIGSVSKSTAGSSTAASAAAAVALSPQSAAVSSPLTPVQHQQQQQQQQRNPNSDFNIDEFFKSLLHDPHAQQQQQQQAPQPVPPVGHSPDSGGGAQYTSMSSYTTMPQPLHMRDYGGGGSGSHGQQQQQQQHQPTTYSQNSQQSALGGSRSGASVAYATDEYNPESWDNHQHHQQHQDHQQQQQQQHDMSWGSSQTDASNASTSSSYAHNHSGIGGGGGGGGGTVSEASSSSSAVSPSYEHMSGGQQLAGGAHAAGSSSTSSSSDYGIGGSVNSSANSGDVDHRLLRLRTGVTQLSAISQEKSRSLDVDHRNLISLTGSPTPVQQKQQDDDENGGSKSTSAAAATATVSAGGQQSSSMWGGSSNAQDMQTIPGLGDTDYRTSSNVADGQLFQPPLPPKIPLLESPPVKSLTGASGGFSLDILGNAADRSPARTAPTAASLAAASLFGAGGSGGPAAAGLLPRPLSKQSPHRSPAMKRPNGQRDNVEAIDMEMSDEDYDGDGGYQQQQFAAEGTYNNHMSTSTSIDYGNQRRQQQQQQQGFEAAVPLPNAFRSGSGPLAGATVPPQQQQQQPPPSPVFMSGGAHPMHFNSPATGGGGGGPWPNNANRPSSNMRPNSWPVDGADGDNERDLDNVDSIGATSPLAGRSLATQQQHSTPPKRVNPFGQPARSFGDNELLPPGSKQQRVASDGGVGAWPAANNSNMHQLQQQQHYDSNAADEPDMLDQNSQQHSADVGGDDEFAGNAPPLGDYNGGPMQQQQHHHAGDQPPPNMMGMGGGGGGGPPRHFMGHGPASMPGPWNNNSNNHHQHHHNNPSVWNCGPTPPPMGFGPPPMRGGNCFRGARGGLGGSPYFRPPPGGMRGGGMPPRGPHFRPNFRGNMRGDW